MNTITNLYEDKLNEGISATGKPELSYARVSASHKNAMQLQSVGWVLGTPAGEIKVGDYLMWNFGGTTKVVAIVRETPKMIIVKEEYTDFSGKIKQGDRKFGKERLVCVLKQK